ncbi:MAG: hypothetical protein GTN78_00705 [Gemmatimonadales bacterium]|nr:hypothetical protein [Gemmatimonadales bacterium]NIN10061.1 hypothetical protein [Gemmatimonadales bacterium]NIQ98712.1 hypothetical protein [Gemmatimonadales bacterium]NIS63590.1 hypothetical protein [Gemmatimonadales bacterium]
MNTRTAVLATLLAAALTGELVGQNRIVARTAVLIEGYTFDSGLVYDKISEFTVPVSVSIPVGRLASVTLSGGYVSVDLTSADATLLADQAISGMLDTEVRVTLNVVPGRLLLIGTGAIPSGIKTVQQDELSILGALSSDLIGFSTSTVGTGGNVGGGFVGALPLGRYALGVGASYKQPLSYQPVSGRDSLLRQGGELRLRAGLEGPLARRTYLRFAGIYAARQKDQLGGQTKHGVGNRIIGYLALSQGLGSAMSVTLYGFDVFRSNPQIEPTALGAAILPRGNLLALGGRLAFALGRRTSFTPHAEYRISAIAVDTSDTTLRRAGSTVRMGAELRHGFGWRTAVVLQGSGVFGNVVQAGRDINLRGFRAALKLELIP